MPPTHVNEDEDTAEPRDTRSTEERLSLIERDLRSHARSLTGLVKAINGEFSREQMDQWRDLLREELGTVGLRVDGDDQVEEARRDFMFVRSLRRGANSTAAKIGWVVIAAILGAVVWLINSGLTFWKTH